ncbi:MAG TPA: hypothetical protein VFG39_07275 [Balneolaceae bacterium]|nr:hypothetical protein [Balneolaceae bacterium]
MTGETASSEVYENKWAASWLGGLIPPEVVNVKKECTNGVAMVETKHSFLNLLVGGLTSGIFTPMTITATCAEASAALDAPTANPNVVSISKNSSEQEFVQAFQQAADQAVKTDEQVYVKF